MNGLVQAACALPGSPSTTPNTFANVQPTAALSQLVTLQLTVQADPSTPFNALGQTIKYNYTIKNTGSMALSLTSTPIVQISGGHGHVRALLPARPVPSRRHRRA